MNVTPIKQLVSAVVLSTVAVSALAAPTNAPKPRCPLGQIAVQKNNMWVCEQPSVKTATQPQRATAQPATPAVSRVTPAKPERAKPDLQIANVMKMNDPTPNVDSFKVYVKNTEGVAAPASKLSVSSTNGGGEVSVEPIPANSGKWVLVKFFSFDRGARVMLEVDSQHKINETNETNNKHAFNW